MYPMFFMPEEQSHLWPGRLHPDIFGGFGSILSLFAPLVGLRKAFVAVSHATLCLAVWRPPPELSLL